MTLCHIVQVLFVIIFKIGQKVALYVLDTVPTIHLTRLYCINNHCID